MPNTLSSRTKVVHYGCAALLLILLVMQFTPFWSMPEGESVSIGGYIWFPSDHANLTTHLQATVSEDFTINDVLVPPILMLLLSAAGAVFCLMKPGQALGSIFGAACGLSGLIGFLTSPALRLGSTWVWQLLICIAVLAGSVYALWATIRQASGK